MAKKHNGGFSLVETLVSIVLLGALMVPTCTALVMTIRLNDKTEALLQAQLAVSSAVETLMAEGIENTGEYATRFPDVDIVLSKEADEPFYTVKVSDKVPEGEKSLVTVNTTIREGGSGS